MKTQPKKRKKAVWVVELQGPTGWEPNDRSFRTREAAERDCHWWNNTCTWNKQRARVRKYVREDR